MRGGACVTSDASSREDAAATSSTARANAASFARDEWRCVYCGTSTGRLTLDHVVPRSRGGESVWENVVTSCATCNHKKGNRTLEESGLELLMKPKPPTPVLFIKIAAPRIPDTWQPYLGSVAGSIVAA